MTCHICGSTQIREAFSQASEIRQCRRCFTGFLDPSIVSYEPDSYYQAAHNYAEILDQPGRLERIRRTARSVMRIIRDYGDSGHRTLLDVGAHTGSLVQEALRVGFDASGIEPNASVVARAQEQGIPLTQGSLRDLPQEKSFDIITMFHVLEHVQDPVAMLRNVQGHLNPGGFFIVEVPNFDSYLARKDGPGWKFVALEHLFYFTQRGLTDLLSQEGFSVIRHIKRNDELQDLNIRKLLHYFTGPGLKRNRLVMKSDVHASHGDLQKESLVKKLVKRVLIAAIGLLGREDHILLITRKS